MKDFFANMNFPRAVILFSLTGSAVLGYLVYQQTERLKELELELRRAPAVVTQIQQSAMRLDELNQAADREGLKGEQSDPELYIRRVAATDNVNIGQVDISVSASTPARGLEDRKYKIRPTNKNERFSRGGIGNFLYKLEADSRRVKVTSVKMTPVERVKPGEVGNDSWTFEVEITSRQTVE